MDKLKEALRYLKKAKKKEDILLRAIYQANIIELEYKIFKSNDYDILLKMIDDCINLKKVSEPKKSFSWFKEICQYKKEIIEKQEKMKNNPKEEEIELNNELKYIFEEINNKFNEGEIKFFSFILSKYKPNGLDENFTFKNISSLKEAYNSNKNRFIKKLNKLYNPQRYKGNKKEERKTHLIMREISTKLNSINYI